MTNLRKIARICALLFGLVAVASNADESMRLPVSIAPQPVAEALASFARLTGLQVVYVSDLVRDLHSPGARGGETIADALAHLLEGTSLRYEFLNERTVSIFKQPATRNVDDKARRPATAERISDARMAALEEIVVTATRTAMRADRVPISLAVWTREGMDASMIDGMPQLGQRTPGVDYSVRSNGGDLITDLVIRGVTNRHSSTVAVFLDDIAIPLARGTSYLQAYPLTFDLERVEVLRGPQGALLGDHAQGGGIRFVTRNPEFGSDRGYAHVETAITRDGEPSFELGAVFNNVLPSTTTAFRLSGWYRSDGGYVDRVDQFTNHVVDRDANTHETAVVRAALEWRGDDVSVTPAITYQSFFVRDTSSFYTHLSDPGQGTLHNGSLVRQPFDEDFLLASVKVAAMFGESELTAVSSYLARYSDSTIDLSPQPPESEADAAKWGVRTVQRSLAQEIRLVSTQSNVLSWLVGAYASIETQDAPHQRLDGDPTFAPRFKVTLDRVDAFGQADLKLIPTVTATVGTRVGRYRYASSAGSPVDFAAHNAETLNAPKFVLSWQADDSPMLYLSSTKGYGSAGVYPGFVLSPEPYPHDTIWSDEIGVKANARDARLALEASAFHAHWNNGPAERNFFFPENSPVPGAAVSDGFELAMRLVPTDELNAELSFAYANARYTRTVRFDDAIIVRNGDSCGTPPWSANASINQRIGLRNGLTAQLRLEDSYRSSAPTPRFSDNPDSPYFVPDAPDVARNQLDLRASVQTRHLDVALYVLNALDAHPSSGHLSIGAPVAQTLRPRTVGLSVNWTSY